HELHPTMTTTFLSSDVVRGVSGHPPEHLLTHKGLPSYYGYGVLGIHGNELQPGSQIRLYMGDRLVTTPCHDLVKELRTIQDRLDALVTAAPVSGRERPHHRVLWLDVGHGGKHRRCCKEFVRRELYQIDAATERPLNNGQSADPRSVAGDEMHETRR